MNNTPKKAQSQQPSFNPLPIESHQIEDYLEHQASNSVLVLEVNGWGV